MELLINKNVPNIETGLREDEMTSINPEKVCLILLTLNRSKISGHSVHLLLEGKMTDTGFSLQVDSIHREKKSRRGGETLQALNGTDSSLALPYFHPRRALGSRCEARSRLEGRESEGKRRKGRRWYLFG